MARIRTIKPDFFTSEDIMALTPLARLLYIGIWLDADREGRLTWKPGTLKVRYLPSDACDVQALTGELIGRRLVVLYGDGLAYIPAFLDHQFINPREGKSKLPNPQDDACARVIDASLRVSDAPSLPSYNIPIPSLPAARVPKQGNGANEPGSLPRDHMHHSICGPSLRICVNVWGCGVLMQQYGGPQDQQKAGVERFVKFLEQSLGPDDSVGDFSWVEKHFQAWLHTIGRAPVPATKPTQKTRTAAEIIASIHAGKVAQ